MIWISVGILAAQAIIAAVTYFTIHRHRVIYGISTAVLRMPKGSSNDVHALRTEHIDAKLKSGKYTVLQIVERYADKDLEIILGKLRSNSISKSLNIFLAHIHSQLECSTLSRLIGMREHSHGHNRFLVAYTG